MQGARAVAMIDSQRLESIVSEAGTDRLRSVAGSGERAGRMGRKPGDPVCEADLAVDAQFLKRELGALLPSAGWLSKKPPMIRRVSAMT